MGRNCTPLPYNSLFPKAQKRLFEPAWSDFFAYLSSETRSAEKLEFRPPCCGREKFLGSGAFFGGPRGARSWLHVALGVVGVFLVFFGVLWRCFWSVSAS